MPDKRQQNFTEEERAAIEARIRRQHPDEEVVIVYEDEEPAGVPAPVAPPDAYAGPDLAQKLAVLMITALAALYLVNPTLGVLEFIPDNLPLLGNLDEFTATAIVISGLNFFGVNIAWLARIFGPGLSRRQRH